MGKSRKHRSRSKSRDRTKNKKGRRRSKSRSHERSKRSRKKKSKSRSRSHSPKKSNKNKSNNSHSSRKQMKNEKSKSPNKIKRSKSRSRGRDKKKKLSRSRSRGRDKKKKSSRSESRGRDKKRRISWSRSRSREKKKKRSSRSRSWSRDKKKKKPSRSRSWSRDKKKKRSSRSRSRDRDKRRKFNKSDKKKSSRSRSRDRDKKRRFKNSKNEKKIIKSDNNIFMTESQRKILEEKEKRLQRVRAWAEKRKKNSENSNDTKPTVKNEESELKSKFNIDQSTIDSKAKPMTEIEPPIIKKEGTNTKEQRDVEQPNPTDTIIASKVNGIQNNATKTSFSFGSTKKIKKGFTFGNISNTEKQNSKIQNTKVKQEEKEVDPLDAFMFGLTNKMSEIEKAALDGKEIRKVSDLGIFDDKMGERFFGDEEGALSDEDFWVEDYEPSWLEKHIQKGKGKELKPVDHDNTDYLDFRKNFFIEPKEMQEMTDEEVKEYRKTVLEGVKIRGQKCPKPIKTWIQCGLPPRVYRVLDKLGFTKPFPIQSQAIPAIMSGCDVIGCAKTGSGKTLAFVLPMLRHILDQPPLDIGDGPIGLIMAPTRELAVQIHNELKKFAKPLELRNVCIYGGAGIADQISDLKRGPEIVTCTPGRMIDMLCANSGRVTNLYRVTYVVLDEADRMFDMGFAPQIMRIIDNIRPDRQTVMFSATFPKSVEILARNTIKNKPIEIIIGGRSTASGDVKQIIEVRDENSKFHRLLELLGKWYQSGCILIFVDQQEAVDNLFRMLVDAGYPSLALHGGMDQTDRDYTITDFKMKLRTVMVATSVVARGLDVKDLVLVVNYTVPNHYEDYVHRVGRTGRAGKKGTAITFVTPDEEKYAPGLVKALKRSKNQVIPKDLQKMADGFLEKVKSGEAMWSSNDGYGGSGFKFNEEEDLEHQVKENALRAGYLPEDSNLEGAVEQLKAKEAEKKNKKAEQATKVNIPKSNGAGDAISRQLQAAKAAAAAAAKAISTSKSNVSTMAPKTIQKLNTKVPTVDAAKQGTAAAKAFAVALSIKQELAKGLKPMLSAAALSANASPVGLGVVDKQGTDYCSIEVEVNDYPQHSRWKVTHKKSLAHVCELNDVSITTKGVYVPPGRKPQAGERKLYLLIEGSTEISVRNARSELVRMMEEAAMNSRPEKELYGKYSVI